MSNKSLKIVYMGTPDFAVLPLSVLVDAGYNVVGVVTNPDKAAGRGQKVQESPVKKYAVAHGLKVLQTEKFKDETFLKELSDLNADLQLVVAFKMLPEVVWNMPPLGTVNLHASLLPDYRGAAPINWAVINGEKYSGVSTFLLKHEIDTGNIIFQEKVEITDTMTAGELHDCLQELGARLLLRTVDAIADNNYPLIEQDSVLNGREAIHAPKIFKNDMRVDWSKDIRSIYNHIRGLSPFPCAWTELRNVNGDVLSMKIYQSEIVDISENFGDDCVGADMYDGMIKTDGKSYFDIQTKKGRIRIKELQVSGKRAMKVDDFLRGFNLENWRII